LSEERRTNPGRGVLSGGVSKVPRRTGSLMQRRDESNSQTCALRSASPLRGFVASFRFIFIPAQLSPGLCGSPMFVATAR